MMVRVIPPCAGCTARPPMSANPEGSSKADGSLWSCTHRMHELVVRTRVVQLRLPGPARQVQQQSPRHTRRLSLPVSSSGFGDKILSIPYMHPSWTTAATAGL